MIESIIKTDVYRELLDTCYTILVETSFAARWTIIEARHDIGKRILEVSEGGIPITELVKNLSVDLQLKDRTLFYCVAFFKKFPDLCALKEGKNIGWHTICRKYLTTHEDTPPDKEKKPSSPIPIIESRLEGNTAEEKYLSYVRSAKCILHPTEPAEPHHFPKTTGAGADSWKVIPLCLRCHRRYQEDTQHFLWFFRHEIFNYFYALILRLFPNAKTPAE